LIINEVRMDKTSILVVEDEAITAMDIQMRLEKLGYKVPAIIDSGEEAILMADKLRPDLILMDIVLKGKMDGTIAAQRISSSYHIPIVFLTAYSDDDTFNRAILSSPYGYLTKPFEPRYLRISVELALFKHNAESKIYSAEQRYRSIMENATCGIFIIDQSGIISELNLEAEKIFGGQHNQMIGTDFKNFVLPSDQAYVDVQMKKMPIKKIIGPYEGRIQRPDGNIRDVEFSAVHVANNEEKFIFAIINDITERNKLQSQKILADKLATVGTLTAGIIHEINNPMTFILSNLNYINEHLKTIKSDNIEQNKLISTLNDRIIESTDGAEKIREIVHNFKGFARVDQGELTWTNIHDVLNDAINMASSQFKNHASFEKNFAADLPLLLLSSSKLHQVFINMLINAGQSMDGDDLHKNIIRVKTYVENDQVCIEINDTGKGISPETIVKIFDPFFTTKPVGIGTGLGLSICYEIIHAIGGQIQVKSELGKGTTFSIYLPINLITERRRRRPTITDTKEITGKRILIVDDEPALLNLLERILGNDNQITKAQGGRAAFNLLAKDSEQFDVIVSDLNMPDINGVELFQYITVNNPKLARHMIFSTGGSYTASMTEFLSSMKNPCLEKPFTREQLFQAINTVLDVK